MDLGTVGGATAASGAVSWLVQYWLRRSEGDFKELKETVDAQDESITDILAEMERLKEGVRQNEKDTAEIKAQLSAQLATLTTVLVSLGRIEGELRARRERDLTP